MAETVLMPQLGISEESAILTRWHIPEGGTVKAGDKLFSIETGKSAFDVESEYSGVVLARFAEEGDEAAVGAPVCAIGKAGESAAKIKSGENATDPNPQASPAPPEPQWAITTQPEPQLSIVNCQLSIGVSPRAKNLAKKLDLDSAKANPTGPEGRVIERDIRALAEGFSRDTSALNAVKPQASAVPQGPGAYRDEPLSLIRKTIAKNMAASLQNSAQLTHHTSFDASALLAFRVRCKKDPERSGITLGDMVLYAVSRVLPGFPALNAWCMGDSLRLFDKVNLACAVDTERGLMVPVLFGASEKSLAGISAEVKNLATRCREGNVEPALLAGGSFTVSNLGQFGIEGFTPILNVPQTGILGVGTITQRVRVVEGCIGAYPAMSLSLTYDHRAVDGAPASRFLQALCTYLERFTGSEETMHV